MSQQSIGKEAEAFQWKLEPWAANLRTDREPATRNGFLEYWLTICNLCPDISVLVNNPSRFHQDRSWTPAESLITCLDHLEQLDFITNNEFTFISSSSKFWPQYYLATGGGIQCAPYRSQKTALPPRGLEELQFGINVLQLSL
ncbi:maltose permease [Penicillium atrosanguineum]|uniref:Uncharacterized protein n=1 Tax=Penicillium atrosanguineum TaxID=1132637 RepID=A0A9W9PSI3_9EURO|nr:maltose permease [Penicillium atrosanguineum]KAJ5138188.1 hypothetical protein N7526_004421 [Penicillium atrosanguineum]KAJ5289275.1 maltose permease [Penicillium atrosanguineum]KAJ5307088.1 hypothetical protein N7476_007744 [Penicillium atrosanguineum]